MTQMNLSTKQKQTLKQRADLVAKVEEGLGRDGLGGWAYQMQTITYRMGKQQDPTVYQVELHILK